MYALCVFLIPSIIGVRIIDYFNKGLTIKNWIYDYIILFLFSFIINIFIVQNVFGVSENVFMTINSDLMLFEYMTIISVMVNIVLVFIGLFVQRNVSFRLEIEIDDKLSKKNKKISKKNRTSTSKGIKKSKDK